ncbi:MAG: hypothetical protein GC204_05085 [Chloroflexi bacterium]|nr:hypothetical protein [Chloroflexota bacterium]
MSTPSDEELLRRLRELKEQQRHNEGLSDRFGDEQFSRHASEIAAEIAQMPPHILHADEIADKLQQFSYSVEDYLVARAAQFLPDVDDLWETVRALPDRPTRETPAETSVVRWLTELRALGARDESLQAAVGRAASLDSYKNPRADRWLHSTGLGASPRHDYPNVLRQHIRDYMKKGLDPSARNSLQTSGDLVRRVNFWRRDPDAAESGSFQASFYQRNILSAIAVLKKLGTADAEIDAIIADAYDPRNLRR